MAWDTSASNNWARPASLNTYLNSTYYNSTYYNSLNSTAQSQIVAKDFSIGAVTEDNNDLAAQVNDENSAKWNGKVALATVSEYIRSNSNKSSCGTISLNNDNYSSCVNTGWMDTTTVSYWWTLSPYAGNSYNSFIVYSNGRVDIRYNNHAVRPAVYLSSEVKITGGNGSQNNPYTLA